MIMKKLAKTFVIANAVGYTVYKLRLDEKLIRAIEPSYREIVNNLKAKPNAK